MPRVVAWTESAFREVYSKYIKPVQAYILRRVRNHHDAEDIAAQVFSQALKHLDPKAAGSPEVAAWLFTSARNATANHARTRRFLATVSIEELGEPLVEPSEHSDPGRSLLDEEELGRLLKAVARLPAEQRKAVILRFVEELPHAEIAQALGRSEGSARVLVHRTLATLRKDVS
ncbi:MAG: RNA polymerase sigma factor [Actinomycetota bacterium]|nr:RNA polymerase sigma factor [Actinomycetota bacterium]